jgi:uncharacterized membrane protein
MESIKKVFGLSTGRIEAFSDGVFAIAITLLILEVKVPQMAEASLWHALLDEWPKFLAYAISFGVIGVFWIGHHIMFHYVKRSNRMLLWLNTVLLMFISAIPFAAALIGEYRDSRIAVAAYGTLLCVCGMTFYGIWRYASVHHRLINASVPADLIKLGSTAVLIAPVIYALAVICAFINPYVSKVIYLIVPLLYLIPSPIDRLVEYSEEE